MQFILLNAENGIEETCEHHRGNRTRRDKLDRDGVIHAPPLRRESLFALQGFRGKLQQQEEGQIGWRCTQVPIHPGRSTGGS